MKTFYTLSILILVLVLASCKQENRREFTNRTSDSIKETTSPSKSETKIEAKESTCKEFSKSMTDFINVLKQDNYRVELREKQDDLSFKSYKEEFEVDKTISFPEHQFKTIYAKRKNKLERMEDNWYPSFSVTEICFPNKLTASENYTAISEIINRYDIDNEKTYDYILQNGNRLIYVNCGAKIFEEYAFGYKERIEEIIKNNKRK